VVRVAGFEGGGKFAVKNWGAGRAICRSAEKAGFRRLAP
jgi:hypothetical protein